MKFPRPQHQEPSEFGGGSGAEVGSADQAPRTSAPTRAPRHNKHPTNKYTNEKNNNAKAHALEPSMTSVSTTTVTDPSSVNTESAGVEDAESSQGGKPAQLEPGNDLTAKKEALLQ